MRLIAYDETPDVDPLEASWRVGATFARVLGRAHATAPAVSWVDLLLWAVEQSREAARKIDRLEVWHHAAPGRAVLGRGQDRDDLTVERLRSDHLLRSALADLVGCLSPRGVVWSRSCSLFAGWRGIEFATALASRLDHGGQRVAAHTHLIGAPWQSGLRTLTRGDAERGSTWSPKEGRLDGRDGRAPSSRTAPRTVGFWCSTIPAGW